MDQRVITKARVRKHAGLKDYLFRNVDPKLWQAVKAKAALESITIRELIERLLKGWLTNG